MRFLQAINSDVSVLIVCNKTGGTIKRRYEQIICKENSSKTFFWGRRGAVSQLFSLNDSTIRCHNEKNISYLEGSHILSCTVANTENVLLGRLPYSGMRRRVVW